MNKEFSILAQDFMDVSEALIVGLDPEGKVVLINNKGCQILGRTEDEILGQDWFTNFIPGKVRRRVRATFKKLMTGKQENVEFFENPILGKDGEERLISWHNLVLTDKKGRISGTLSSGEDITQRSRDQAILGRREKELSAILETVVDGIITIDQRGSIQSFNSAARRIFGYAEEELIGRNVHVLMPNPDASSHDDYLANYLRTGDKKIIGIGREVVGLRKDGTTFPLYLAVGEMRLDEGIRFVGIIRDLTDYKKMQDEILQSQSLASIGEMVASITHEIRNPLAGIGGAIEVLRDGLQEDDPQRAIMEQVMEQIGRLNNTVRQLLTLSKPWNPKKQNCELGSLLERVTLSASRQSTFKKVQLIWRERVPVEARVDPALFERVVWNLLDNAVQAMPEGGEIRYYLGEESGNARLTVEDTGTGIPEEAQKDLFRAFFSTRTRGTGLGLAICKKIMEAHGGTISIQSEEGHGTRVSIVFPRS